MAETRRSLLCNKIYILTSKCICWSFLKIYKRLMHCTAQHSTAQNRTEQNMTCHVTQVHRTVNFHFRDTNLSCRCSVALILQVGGRTAWTELLFGSRGLSTSSLIKLQFVIPLATLLDMAVVHRNTSQPAINKETHVVLASQM